MRVTRAGVLLVALTVVATFGGTFTVWNDMPEEWRRPRELPEPRAALGDAPPNEEYTLADGYRIELVARELTYPTMVAFDDDGATYVVESGYAYGPSVAIPRVLHIDDEGTKTEVARLNDGPVTSIAWHDGALYAIGGRDPARVWRVEPSSGNVTLVLSGFPVWGRHFTSDLAFSDDGWMYFAAGDPTNSGVLGLDDYYTYGYLSIFPAARSIPCVQLVLEGQNFRTRNPFDPHPDQRIDTGAFHRFGERAHEGEIIQAREPPGCNGAVFRARPDGSDLQVVATGVRHVQGLGFAPDGRLLAVETSMDTSGSRPVKASCDPLLDVREGAWYGFPDYACGRIVEELKAENRSAPEPLLRNHPPLADAIVHRFEANAGTRHFAFSRGGAFGFEGEMFVAQYGSQFEYPPKGHRILRVDLDTGEARTFYENLVPGPNGTAPDRPTAVRFGPDGALYVVDFGELTTTTKTFHPSALTGALWRIRPTGGE